MQHLDHIIKIQKNTRIITNYKFSLIVILPTCLARNKMSEHHHHHHGLSHHKKDEEKPVEAVVYSETTTYSDTGYGGGYTETTTAVIASQEPEKNYEKEVREHKHKEHMGELDALAAGAFALVYSIILDFLFCTFIFFLL